MTGSNRSTLANLAPVPIHEASVQHITKDAHSAIAKDNLPAAATPEGQSARWKAYSSDLDSIPDPSDIFLSSNCTLHNTLHNNDQASGQWT